MAGVFSIASLARVLIPEKQAGCDKICWKCSKGVFMVSICFNICQYVSICFNGFCLKGYPLVMTNIAKLAHRNRGFTMIYLLKMVIFYSFFYVYHFGYTKKSRRTLNISCPSSPLPSVRVRHARAAPDTAHLRQKPGSTEVTSADTQAIRTHGIYIGGCKVARSRAKIRLKGCDMS